ncbi:sensor histidine kinase [Tychonema bourrellyi FEM_GT703]|uniref:histidine kinase n=1 Tax=Tychonema bourrellyi FEM_GT703 TaxID=2040638 RepID=A0A2G4F0U2_9CYAN|nr:HAMP domain-containing sensor histidine kinase [Tychonema bourrellyi]PHX55067.1 sensor histidine kinase [Tychonema bourrellyi FEM_GT703]
MHYQVDAAQIGGQIYQIIATSSDGETLLQIAHTLGAACQADYCFVTAVTDNQIAIPNAGWPILGDRTNSTVISDAAAGLTETTRLNSPLSSIEHPIFANVLSDGEMIAISDIDNQTTNTPNSHLPFRAILASPVRFGGAINGMIMLGKWQPHQWSATSQQCVELASDAIASAIAHIQKNQEIANLNQQLQRQATHENLLGSVAKELNTNLEIPEILQQVIIQNQTIKDLQALVKDSMSQLEQSLDIQGQLYEQSANQLDQLRKWKQIKDDFLDCVNHELRTPLTIMNLAIVMLKQAEQRPESRAKYLDILDQKCIQEIGLIEDLLAVKQFESKQVPICLLQINIKHLIQDLARDFEKKWEDKGLALTVELPQSLPALKSDRDSLNRILLEMLVNAGKYSAFGTTIVLHVSEVAGRIVVSVSNLGRGILADDLPHIFEKFYRGTGVTQEVIPGMGLGLALVKYLVKHLNGTIEVDSRPSENSEGDELWRTSFTLTLPQFHEKLSSLES